MWEGRLPVMALSAKIGPSILNSDLSALASECQRLLDCGADYLHLDVMDGHFVPNLTFGHPVVACLRPKLPNVFFDMHMMVSEPQRWIADMAEAGAQQYTFHFETTGETTGDVIRKIKECGMLAGLGIKPATPVETLFPYLDDVDMVLIMTVEPGFGGQSFMADMMPKVKSIRSKSRLLNIEVDGGVGPNNIHLCAEAGANMIVSGSAIVRSADPRTVISSLKKAVQDVLQREDNS